MNTIKISILLVLTFVSTNLYAANPADLTFFERFSEGGFGKAIFDKDATIMIAKFPEFKNNFSLLLSTCKNQEGLETQTGRFIKKFTPNFDAALKINNYTFDNSAWTKSYAAFDLHGNMLETPAGIGIHIPFDNEDNIKVGPRISFGNLTSFLTVSEDKDYVVGATYRFDKNKIDLAYSKKEIWSFRISTLVEFKKTKFFPELRLKITPEDTLLGFGLGFCF